MIGHKNYFPFGISIKFIPMNVSGLPGKAAILEVTLLSDLTMPHNPPPESDPYEHRRDIESIQWADVGETIAAVLVDAIDIKEQYHMKSIHVNMDGDSDLLDYAEKEIWNGIETGLEMDDRFTIDTREWIIRYNDSHIDY